MEGDLKCEIWWGWGWGGGWRWGWVGGAERDVCLPIT